MIIKLLKKPCHVDNCVTGLDEMRKAETLREVSVGVLQNDNIYARKWRFSKNETSEPLLEKVARRVEFGHGYASVADTECTAWRT